MDFNPEKLYEQWKFYYTKDKQLFLIGYSKEYKDYLVRNENKKLGIYLLDIDKRIIKKESSFNYNHFIENKKEDKLYVLNDEAIIAYYFKTNTQIEKKNKTIK